MTTAKLTVFSGLRPRMPPALLPPNTATIARNCDFAYGELRNTKAGYKVNDTNNTPRSIYTEDGLNFYTWTTDVNAVKSPLVKDTTPRIYYTPSTGGVYSALRPGAGTTTGGPPASNSVYKAGVPRPTKAPALTLPATQSVDGATFTAKFHYESGGIKYQEGDITLTEVTAKSKWRFTPPTMNTSGTAGSTGTFKATGFAQWRDTPNGGQYDWTTFAVASITVLSANSIQYNGTTYSNVGFIRDANSLDHETESLFSLQTYAVLSTGNNASSATPSDAVPVIRLIATKTSDNSKVFDIYSDNSTLNPGTNTWKLAITKDQSATTYTIELTNAIAEADKETRAYVYVYVNNYGEPGPPSPPALVTTTPTMDVSLTITKDLATGYCPINEIWIYRTPSGSTVADFFYVGKVTGLSGNTTTVSSHGFLDNIKGAELNEPLSSTNYYAPPDDLVGLMSLANGILCAWRGAELWFSEAYKPWAWNPANVKPLNHNIVGGIAHGSGALVTTVQYPYLISGVSPDSMTASKLNIQQAGVSKWSIASVDGAVAYASNDGIVVVSGGSGSLARSEIFFTREVWRERYKNRLSSMVFSVWDGRLVVFSNAQTDSIVTGDMVPFMIRLDEAEGTLTDLPELVANCAFISLLTDQFYYGYGNAIYQFNGGTDQTAVWQGREEWMGSPDNFGFAQAIVKSGSWTVEFYADGDRKSLSNVGPGTTNFRLPGGYKGHVWQVKITGTGRFQALRLGRTAVELAKV